MTTESTPAKRPIWPFFVSLVFVVAGLIIGSVKQGRLCGSAFSPDHGAAEMFDTMARGFDEAGACEKASNAAAIGAWTLILLGVVLLLARLLIPARTPAVQVVQHQAPSTADELAKLAQLQASGVITAEEFAAEKARLLGTSPTPPPPSRAPSVGEQQG